MALFIYVLQCVQNKYYIGKTRQPNFRIEQHLNNDGSAWTKKYPPIKIIEIIPNCDDFDEDKYTVKYMKKYGITNVRGGSFSQVNLTLNQLDVLRQMCYTASDQCYTCGQIGHFSKNCKIKKDNKPGFVKRSIDDFDDDNDWVILKNTDFKKCNRCGRKNHYTNQCYAQTDISGKMLQCCLN